MTPLSSADVSIMVSIIGIYMAAVLVIGWMAYRVSESTPADFFLANRTLGPIVLTMTLIASVFSAFTFLGAAGISYRFGTGWFMAQATGNAMLAFTLWLVGRRVYLISRSRNYLTPAQLFGERFGNPRIRDLWAVLMLIASVPYLAIQPVGAGYAFSGLTGGAISYEVGATLIMVVMVAYVLLGGMRSVAWTDTLQGFMMIIFLGVAMWVAVSVAGGFGAAGAKVAKDFPALFTRPGPNNFWTLQSMISWWLIFLSNVAFLPIILIRFMSAKNVGSLKFGTVAWPVVTIVVVFFTTFLGVLARSAIPDLKQADQIVPTLLSQFAHPVVAALIMAGALAAMMSTGDSFMHYVGASFVKDFWQPYVEPKASDARLTWVGRGAILVVSVLAWFIALKPPSFIVNLGAAAFTIIGVMAPAGYAALFWRRATVPGVAASMILAALYVIAQQFKWLPASWNMGFMPIVPGLVIGAVVVAVGSWITKAPRAEVVGGFFDVWEKRGSRVQPAG
ncbi:MAG: sodium:solute symporter family protein [Betaproteobacteria bacterium]|nr:sodium:solute symporter family protein [Betaproteobacteria bacterium]